MVDALTAAGSRLTAVLADSAGMAGTYPAGAAWGEDAFSLISCGLRLLCDRNPQLITAKIGFD